LPETPAVGAGEPRRRRGRERSAWDSGKRRAEREPEDARLSAAYADPLPDTADGRLVYREPPECAGLTERSKAFFLLNRHRLGAIVAASLADFERRGREGASESCLRLYDDCGRVLALAGCTAGYMGEGCHGTLWVLRLCGFPEGAADAGGHTRLERTVFGRRAFWLTTGPGPRAPQEG
jgi:hypothetical protein